MQLLPETSLQGGKYKIEKSTWPRWFWHYLLRASDGTEPVCRH